MTLRFPALLSGLSGAVRARRAAFWGATATTVRTTPWHIDTLRRRTDATRGPGLGSATGA